MNNGNSSSAVNYVLWLRWLLSHLGSVQQLVELAKDVVDAVSLSAKWSAIKELGDALLPIIEDFPVGGSLDAGALALAESEITAAGLNPDTLKKLWPVFEMLLPILLGQLKKDSE